MIYEHGEIWWNDINRGKLIHPSELSGSEQEEQAKEMVDLALQSIFVHTSWVIFLHAIKSYDIGLRLYFSSKGRCAADFYRP
jgi:hypothetical protein